MAFVDKFVIHTSAENIPSTGILLRVQVKYSHTGGSKVGLPTFSHTPLEQKLSREPVSTSNFTG